MNKDYWNVVAPFSLAMEKKLCDKSHKTDWRDLPIDALIRKLEIELEEMKIAYQYESPTEAMGESVDVANFALMVWDRIRQSIGDDE